ncbi:MAG: PAS domain S-box protein, partial [Pyrinomonadaceae bacterium]|nr:PAS domain S-box protein [Pyrinomonadaceae bacterium]
MPFSLKTSSSTLWLEICRWLMVSIGVVILWFAILRQIQIGLNLEILLLAIVTFVIAAKINVKITRFNSTVTVADVFIFIALLNWGTQAAILIAIAEAIGSTSQLSKRYKTFFVNVAMGIIASCITGSIVTLIFGSPEKLAETAMPLSFFFAICLMGATQYVSVLTMLMILQLFRLSFNEFKTWLVQFYLWSFFSFFAASLAAGYVVKIIGNVSVLLLLVIIPIIVLLYLTYKTYLRNLDKLQESEARFRGSFDYSTIGMALVSPEGNWLQVNQSLCKLLNRTESYLLKSKYDEVIHDADSMSFNSKIIGLLANEFPAFQTELRLVNIDGSEIWALLSVSTARDVQDNIKHLIFQTQDTTSRKKAENELLYKASHDSLTGLCNR